MSRSSASISVMIVAARMLAAAGLVVAVAPARADVMEIGGDGHVWIVGGPAAAQATARPGTLAGSPASPEAVDGAPVAAALTEVDVAAGPAAWRDRVAQLAAKYDVSAALLEALVWQESRWNTGAVSPAGARGLAQLMPGTARQMGIDPANPHANLEGGARYLRMQLDAFGGDVEKALAAYNAGPGRVIRANGIPAIRETRDYVASIMTRLSNPVRR